MIMPVSMALGSQQVESELHPYLSQNWQSIIAGDVDGTNSIRYDIDKSGPNLNQHSANRRVARTVFLSTAPIGHQDNSGIELKKIHLGVVQPGAETALFSEALRHREIK